MFEAIVYPLVVVPFTSVNMLTFSLSGSLADLSSSIAELTSFSGSVAKLVLYVCSS